MKKKFLILTLMLFLLPTFVNAYTFNNKKIEYPESRMNTVGGHTDDDYMYYLSGKKVYRYDLKKDVFEEIYQFEKYLWSAYIKGNILYGEVYLDDNKQTFIGIDLTTKKEVYRQGFENNNLIGRGYIFDDSKNVYIISDTVIYSYGPDGKLIDSYDTKYNSISFNDISPDGKIMFLNLVITPGYPEESYIAINNGHFIKEVSIFHQRGRTPFWTFLADKIHAVNQYGEIAEFSTSNLKNISYKLVAPGIQYDYYDYFPSVIEDQNSFYMSGPDGNIYIVNKSNYKKTAKILVKEKARIYKVVKDNNNLQVVYMFNGDRYITTLNINNFVKSKTITIKDHKTLTYTKDDVISKYASSLATYDYSKGYYKSKPNFTAPYYEGVLQDGVKNDVLKQFNYYRYLSGLNEVTINDSKMQRSQKGAFINAVNKSLSHFPTKPDGMTDDFYNEASGGTGASAKTGDTYSGNVSAGESARSLISGFVDEIGNEARNVGHRSSMLDPYAKSISFGFIAAIGSPWYLSSGAVSVYYDNVNNNPDKFYAWPPAGYLPTESFLVDDFTMWSLWIDDDYEIQDNTNIVIECQGKKYPVPNFSYDEFSRTIYYSVPTELNKIIRKDYHYVTGIPISFKINNLLSDIDIVNIEYTTTFIKATGLGLNKENITMLKGKTDKLVAKALPSNTTPSKLTWKSSNDNVVKVDNNGNITAVGKGTATITVTSGDDGSTTTCQVTVDYLKGDLNENGKIEVVDSVEALKYYVELNKINDRAIAIADFNNNNKIDVSDAVEILKLYVNK